MSERFDELSRAMARPASRRSALKALGGAAAAAAAATVIRPFRASAALCPAGASPCGSGCCAKGQACTDRGTACCCPSGATPCGVSCCSKGVACVDAANGRCGCPSGTTPCGSGANLKCCAAGTACSPSNTSCTPVSQSSTTVKRCCSETAPCPQGSTCNGGLCETGTVPAACTRGTDPETGDHYVVCQASATEAWISSDSIGHYHALQICQQLGYATLGSFGGTCGNVCGTCEAATSCSSPGTKTFDGRGSCGSDANGPILCFSVEWQCLA